MPQANFFNEVHELLKQAHRGGGFAVNALCRRMHLHPLTFKKVMKGAPVTHRQLRKVILAFMDSPRYVDDRQRLEFFDRLLEAWRREEKLSGN